MAVDWSLYGTGLPGDPLGEGSYVGSTQRNGDYNSGMNNNAPMPVAQQSQGRGGTGLSNNAYEEISSTDDLVNPSSGQGGFRNVPSQPTPTYVDPYYTDMQGLIGYSDQQAAEQRARTQPYVDASYGNYIQQRNNNNQILNQQGDALNAFSNADSGLYGDFAATNRNLAQRGDSAVSTMGNAFGRSEGMDAGNVGQLGSSLGRANVLDEQNVGELGQSLGQANAMDAANYGQLAGQAAGMRQLTAQGYGADVTANPQDLARQEAAYGAFGDFAGGQYDYTSQAAQAYADPEALAAQKEVMGTLRGQMDPHLTDAERYLYMQNRLAQEQSNRGNRDANLRELERSGMSGSTMALSNLNASSQESATTRALADLGANAKAIDRASQATRDYGNMANVVSGQSFQQAYGRGQAADQASQFNTNTRLQGTIGQANEANQMRTANDALSTFNKSQRLQQQRFQDQYAADQQNAAWGRDVDVSNAGFQQSSNLARNATVKSNAGFTQSQDLARNAGALSDAQFTQSGNIARNATNLGNADLANIGQQGQRKSDETRAGMQMNSDWLTGQQNLGTMGMQAGRDNTAALGLNTDTGFRQAGLDTAATNRNIGLRGEVISNAAEDRRAAAAQSAAAQEAERQRHEAARPHSLIDILEFKNDW